MANQPFGGTAVPSLNPQTTPAWQALERLAGHYAHQFDLRQAFTTEPKRFQQHSVRAPHMLVDLSKNLWDEPVVEQLLALAMQMDLPERRSQLLNGEIVNHTEQQAAVHSALRLSFTCGRAPASAAMAQNCVDLSAMLAMADTIRADATAHDVVHIGIGGSSLGPELALQALRPYAPNSASMWCPTLMGTTWPKPWRSATPPTHCSLPHPNRGPLLRPCKTCVQLLVGCSKAASTRLNVSWLSPPNQMLHRPPV